MKINYGFLIAILFYSCSESNPGDRSTINNPDTVQMTEEDSTNTDTTDHSSDGTVSYLALGDSYTIGERVEEEQRWPVQLVNRLRESLDENINDPTIIATTGWTTDELQTAINNSDLDPPYDLVSLLIGVNNQYRGYPVDQYRKEFEELLQQAISFAGHDTSSVFVVSIPDYGVTPFAANMDQAKIGREIDEYNSIAKAYAEQLGVKYFDITPISREAETNTDLLAGDGLHPSGEMYSRWVDLMETWALQVFDE